MAAVFLSAVGCVMKDRRFRQVVRRLLKKVEIERVLDSEELKFLLSTREGNRLSEKLSFRRSGTKPPYH